MIDIERGKKEVLDWIAQAVRTSVDEIDLTKSLPDVGLDSNDAVHLVCTIEAVLRIELPEDVMTKVKTVGDILSLMDEYTEAA